MKVFVLMKCFDYDQTDEVISVYSTSELAEKACQIRNEPKKKGTFFWVKEFEINPTE